MSIVIGIDLGTTNSSVALKKIDPSMIENEEGSKLTPSVVAALPKPDSSFDILVGKPAQNLLKQYPQNTIVSIKRLMGRDLGDIQVQNWINSTYTNYDLREDQDDPEAIGISFAGEISTPTQISSHILKKLLVDTKAHENQEVRGAVVTVPAYFTDRQKSATRKACELAGINLIRLLPEPTAAAISFGKEFISNEDAKSILVFDLGGGTFDVSLLNWSGGAFMEVTKGGDMWLGGDDINELILDLIFKKAEDESECGSIKSHINALDETDKLRFLAEIKEKAEALKVELSADTKGELESYGILKDSSGELIDIDVEITRDEFENAMKEKVEKLSDITTSLLREVGFDTDLIDHVLMVGGSSLIPCIQEKMKALFGENKVHIHPRPMFAITEGAAIMAQQLSTNEEESSMKHSLHATSHDYYVKLAGGDRFNLIPRNTPLPCKVQQNLAFSEKGQMQAHIQIFNEISGIMEPVGSLWFHRSHAYENENNLMRDLDNKIEFTLEFEVNEDNIINLRVWPKSKPTKILEAKMTQSGLEDRLYQELEETLETMVHKDRGDVIAYEWMLLGQVILDTINNVSDPLTGEINQESKQKARNQMKTLSAFRQLKVSPLAMHDFALASEKGAFKLLSKDDQEKLRLAIGLLKENFRDLKDQEKVFEGVNIMNDLLDNNDQFHALTRAELIASETSAKALKRHIQGFLSAVDKGYEDLKNQEFANLVEELSCYGPSGMSGPSGFNRDVRLV